LHDSFQQRKLAHRWRSVAPSINEPVVASNLPPGQT
jgi:hypothetical protein